MARERVEVVRRIYDDWGRGEFRTAVDVFDPHIVLVLRPEFPDAGVYLGPDGIATYTRDLLASWADFAIEAEELIDAGDSVVAAVRQRGVGQSSGAVAALRYFMVWTFRGDKVVRLESILEREQALEAVGLREGATSRANAELHREALDAFNRRDLDAFLALTDPDVEANSRLVAIEGGYHGHEGTRRWWANLLDILPDFTIEVVEIRDFGDVTLAVLRNRGHGAGSDIPVEQRLWQVGEWRDGKIVWWSSHEDEAEALEAAARRA